LKAIFEKLIDIIPSDQLAHLEEILGVDESEIINDFYGFAKTWGFEYNIYAWNKFVNEIY
jgi:hypothetical protein